MYGAQIWFDGGIEGKARPAITAMLKKLQPKAVAFNGCVVQGGVEPSPPCLLPISYARPVGRSSHYLTASPTSMKPQNKTAGWNRNQLQVPRRTAARALPPMPCVGSALRLASPRIRTGPPVRIYEKSSFLLKCLPSIVLPTKQTLNLSRQAPVKLRCDCS
jgi:hypothetical protein